MARIRKKIRYGWTQHIDKELNNLKVGTVLLKAGESIELKTKDREFALVLIYGECNVKLSSGLQGKLGPRENPFEHPPWGLFATREETILLTAKSKTLIGVGSAPAKVKMSNKIVEPSETGGGLRGVDNWERTVRFVCWSDNTEGNMLMAGETCTPSGNWSTMPPHRHQYDILDKEVAYEEAYLFQFSKPQGFGLIWKFDEEKDQAYSIRDGDVISIDGGYHPLVCGPGSTLYHLTFMAGPNRISRSSIHPDYDFLLEEQDMNNPYKNQYIEKEDDK